jgi:hypothetical protein
LDGVVDVGEVAAGVEGAEGDVVLGEGLGDDGGDDGTGGLSRTIGVEGADGDGGDSEGSVVGFDEFVGANFAGGVGGLTLEGVGFVDGDAQGGAVDFAGGGVDEGDVELAGGFEDVEGAEDVGLDGFDGVEVGVGDGDEGAEVVDEVAAGGGLEDGGGVAQVAEDEFYAIKHFSWEGREEADVGAGVISNKSC